MIAKDKPRILMNNIQHFRGAWSLHFQYPSSPLRMVCLDTEDGGIKVHRRIGNYLFNNRHGDMFLEYKQSRKS
jgi:hypothetical protein